MIKEQLLILSILCFWTATIYAETAGLVNEFKIEDSNNGTDTNETEHHNLTKPNLSSKIINKKQRTTSNETKTKTNLTENGALLYDSSMYTESDLEETKSTDTSELDGPDTKEKEANNTKEKHKRKQENKKEEISSVYTESDLEATASQDEKKNSGNQEKDKRSAGSYLVVLHKRDINHAEQEEGSGEGSGQEPDNTL
ncbi:uncharacterized protein LOC123551784 isoform X2 [Mercenaria mercenaria]|uniref:uncharacterized protein LOC123551784 isoform X2 n=1 Tax=Mercenaria mercenaria TaxID=6596 RepID=UPI00234E5F7C|nr:uncharacterized protein LOC123551784 isoform X2 [Mercenaria mercenaria]